MGPVVFGKRTKGLFLMHWGEWPWGSSRFVWCGARWNAKVARRANSPPQRCLRRYLSVHTSRRERSATGVTALRCDRSGQSKGRARAGSGCYCIKVVFTAADTPTGSMGRSCGGCVMRSGPEDRHRQTLDQCPQHMLVFVSRGTSGTRTTWSRHPPSLSTSTAVI